MQRKPKFKIGDLKNTENLTSHHITYFYVKLKIYFNHAISLKE